VDDDRGRRAVADALPLRRRPDGDGGDEIEEESVDDAEQVADDCRYEADRVPALVDDPQADCMLPDRLADERLGADVVGEEDEERPPAFRVNTYRVEAVLGLRLPASGDEPEHDDQHEDDDRVDEDGDEAESYACVFHGARGG